MSRTDLASSPPRAEHVTPGATTDTAPVPYRPLLDLVSDGLRVPVLGGDERRYADLDGAATTPALAAVAARIAELLPYAGSVHRGTGLPSQWSTALLEDARVRVASALGARSDDVVVFTRNTTDALNLLASAVPAGGGVVTLDIEHHANLLPWQRRDDHRIVGHAPTLDATLVRLAAALDERPAALVAITAASNVTGELVPLGAVARIAHARGARVAVDGAQLLPHAVVDIAALGVDYIAFSGHKLYAPFGAGALVGRRDWLELAPPYLAGGGAVRDVTTVETHWADAPQRHEAGTPNLVGAVALADALELLGALPTGALAEHERTLRELLEDGLAAVPGVRLHRIWEGEGAGRIGVVCFTVDGTEPGKVAAYLSAEHAVGVRDGRFCAHPLTTALGFGSAGALRASLGGGSRYADVDRIVGAIEILAARGPRHRYLEQGGRWRPEYDDRRPPAAAAIGGRA